jgi:hypothetical protein
MEAMRPISRALVGIILIACSSQQLVAAETGSRWWPFGQRDETRMAQPPGVAAQSPSSLQTSRRPGALKPAQQESVASAPLGQQPQSPENAADAPANENWMLSSPKRKIGWPQLTKPQMPKTGLFAQKAEPDATRNSWLEKTPAEPKPSPLKPLADGAQKVSRSTKAAWHKTVDAFTPGEPAPPTPSTSSRIAKRDGQPTFWQRVFGQQEELQQPQTVPEWMSQKRVDRR